ncbi:uncharacterized protein LOC115710633 [Cannabis sativa]|uniref:uncharacterized protein LOC115710633 n=1 Tax=Cannabis sativa TaxID=3483 RepID=UPI0029CA59FF|nr:uncharacterized protein LOC115710633 [Cannabis sativa]
MANKPYNNNYLENPTPNYYHLGLRNHENLSYGNTKNVLQPPPGFNAQQQEEKKSLEEILGTFMIETNKRFNKNETRLDNMETHLSNITASMKNIEVQVGQLANVVSALQKNSSFPVLDGGLEDKSNGPEVEDTIEAKEETPEEKPTDKFMKKEDLPLYKLSIPYSQKFMKKKFDEDFAKFLEIFRNININIYFIDALEQMPNYVKFMKEVLAKKKKFGDYETVSLAEECSAIIQKKLLQKLKDPGSFLIPCEIGGLRFEKSLCDLGASINLMSLSVFKKLGICEFKPTKISLQLADRSFTYPRRIIEDVLIKVGKLVFPTELVVLDMEEDKDIPLILKRPFLATGGVFIDVQRGHLTLSANDEEIKFDIYKSFNQSNTENTCNMIESCNSNEVNRETKEASR